MFCSGFQWCHIRGLVQKRHNSSTLAMELCLSCTNPSIFPLWSIWPHSKWLLWYLEIMMTSSNGSIFRVTGPFCGEFTGHRWIPRTKASDAELWCFLWSAPWINDSANNREAGDLRCNRAHYDVIVMFAVITTKNLETHGCLLSVVANALIRYIEPVSYQNIKS